jgi:NAD(P) transhydrogenase subunit alpha
MTIIDTLTIFVLATWVGFEVITKVPPILHTPLTSGSNAISGITIVGSMIAVASLSWATSGLGFFATVFAMINVVGGFPRDAPHALHVPEEGLTPCRKVG